MSLKSRMKRVRSRWVSGSMKKHPSWLQFRARLNVEALEARDVPAVNPIVTENQLAGTPQSTWGVSGAGDSTIQGFATDISVNHGQTVSFKINDSANKPYHIDIYRMGYYQGNGARLITTIPNAQVLKQVQPNPLTDTATGLVDAGNWAVSASWAVPAAATSGLYFARVARDDTGGASLIWFVVRDDEGNSDLLFQTADTTWQAYNTWGGYSLYQHTGASATVTASSSSDAGRAVKVSYNRPIVLDGSADGYNNYNSPLHAEYPMIRWLEANGYSTSYSTDVDSDRRGAEIREHKVFLSVGHDEYWSAGQRNNVEAARDAGVNLAFFSGNENFWKVRWENSVDGSGTAYRTLVCYKESKDGARSDPLDLSQNIWTGTWRDDRFSPPADGGRPENALSGTMYMVDRTSVELGVSLQVPEADGKLRFWRNTTVATQSAGQVASLGQYIVGYETDEDLDNGYRPAGLIDMSSTTFSTNEKVNVPWGTTVGAGTSTHKLTLYRAASGALVFGAGTVQWSWGLDGTHNDVTTTPSVPMRQATVNLFADMGVQPGSLQSGLAAATASSDHTAPTSVITSPAGGSIFQVGSSVTITGTAADSGGGLVGGVEVSVDNGTTWHPAVGRGAWSYTWTPASSGPLVIRSRAADDSGNIETPSSGVSVTISTTNTYSAGYGFEEATGTTTADASGKGNTGTITSATHVAGKYGNGLSFNGTSSWVTVASATSLNLTGAMTLEAWVKPAALSGWQSVILKEAPAGLAYSLYANDGAPHPAAYAHIGTDKEAFGSASLPLNAWSHLAATYDGTTLRMYVNATQVGALSLTGSILTSTGALRIGGNSVWGEYFNGVIDEVRVYSRALLLTEIQTDMNTPVAGSDTTAPTVSVTAPANNANVSGTVSVTATASDNVGVLGVQFKLDGVNLGAEDTASPFSVSWNTATIANGTHVLTAVARDAAGNTATASTITVNVNNDVTPPTVSITAPTEGATVGGAVGVTASASDNVGVVGVQFKLDGANLGAEDMTSPYSISWDSTAVANGSHTLTAIARDAAGNTTISSTRTVVVFNPDVAPPAVSLTAPTDNATVTGALNVTANAADNVGVAGVQFLLDDSNFGAEDVTSPYSVNWDTTSVANGKHTLAAIARDAAGNQTVAATVTVNVNNDLAPPSVSLTAPADGTTIAGTVSVTANASDNVGVVGVQFKLDGANLGAEDTAAPYAVAWDTSPVANGSHVLTAVARDAFGNSATSSSVTITVYNDFLPPTVSLSNPADGATVSGTLAVTAEASDNTAVIGVQLKLDGANLGAELTAPPYSMNWDTTAASNGSHTLTAIARDAAGNQTTSTPITITVFNPDTTSPSVALTTPADSATVSGSVSVAANASDNVGVVGIQFLLDGSNLGAEDTTSPYAVSWGTTSAANGAHILSAVARDAAGNTTTASIITVIVNNDVTPPSVGLTSPANGATVSGTTSVAANASDNVGVMGVQFKLDGTNLGSEDTTSPYSVSWNSVSVANGTHTLTAVARDAAGNSATAATFTVTVNNAATGLVGAWAFEEGSGTSTGDSSGHALTGTLSNTTWSTAGKYGKALSFNGTNAWVTVADNALLHLTSAMTVEAWVRPAAASSDWAAAVLKERGTTGLAYALYATDGANKPPAGYINVGGTDRNATAASVLALNTWSHLAVTYDGTTIRLYLNGTQVATKAQTGNINSSTAPLRFGGDSVWGEYFNGLIDEVRVYSIALTAAQVQSDMNTAIGSPQVAAEGSVPAGAVPLLSEGDLAPIAAEAVLRWQAAGLHPSQLAALSATRFLIRDLGATGLLGMTPVGGSVVTLDDDGAGRGWYVDTTPADNTEFSLVVGPTESRTSGGRATGKYDLLTVVLHELGHTLGFDDLDSTTDPHDLMSTTLATGTRRLAPFLSLTELVVPNWWLAPTVEKIPLSAEPTLAYLPVEPRHGPLLVDSEKSSFPFGPEPAFEAVGVVATRNRDHSVDDFLDCVRVD